MKLGIGSYSFGWQVGVAGYLPAKPMQVWDLLKRAKQYDVRVIQIADNMPLHILAENELEAFRLSVREANIEIEVGMRGLKHDLLDCYIELAVFFQSPILRIVMDMKNYEPSEEEVVSILKDFEPKLLRNGVVLAIENHDRFSSKSLVRIMNSVNTDAVGICLDTVNSMGAGEGIETIIGNLVPYTVNLHLKDFQIKRVDYLMGFVVEGCPAGKGRLNIPELLEKVYQSKRNVNAILELWTPPEPSIIETVMKEDAWVTESITYLRKYISL